MRARGDEVGAENPSSRSWDAPATPPYDTRHLSLATPWLRSFADRSGKHPLPCSSSARWNVTCPGCDAETDGNPVRWRQDRTAFQLLRGAEPAPGAVAQIEPHHCHGPGRRAAAWSVIVVLQHHRHTFAPVPSFPGLPPCATRRICRDVVDDDHVGVIGSHPERFSSQHAWPPEKFGSGLTCLIHGECKHHFNHCVYRAACDISEQGDKHRLPKACWQHARHD